MKATTVEQPAAGPTTQVSPAPKPLSPQSGGRPQPRATPSVAGSPIDSQVASLSLLLKIEADVRRATTPAELVHLMANETRAVVRARQVFVLGRPRGRRGLHVLGVSSLAVVDRQVPLIRWVEDVLARLKRTDGTDKSQVFVLPAYADPSDPSTAAYPFANMLWMPLPTRAGGVQDGLLLARETAWGEADRHIVDRLVGTYGHALDLLRSRPPALLRRRGGLRVLLGRGLALATGVAVVALGLLPMPITALAPIEIVARDPAIVAMPVDGIVQKVLVEPNSQVERGTLLVRLVDTVARNKLEVAAREVAVAEARLEQASSLALSDPKGRHEMGIAQSELALHRAERDYARDMLEQMSIYAQSPGIAVFSDRKELEGKPLGTGDRLMQIARPGEVELRIDLPVADSIVLQTGARVRAFLDSDPLNAVTGEVMHVDYQARLSEAGVAAYRVIARIVDTERAPPRLGTRGTAQVEGPPGNLALLLFRRPFSAIRQRFGL